MARGALAAGLALGLQALGAQAQLLDGWEISGSNHLRVERYEARGDEPFSPFRHLGTTGFDELTLQGLSRPSPYSLRRFFFSGVANDSPYRSQDRGFVPERVNFLAESGESRLPWRAEAGDFFAFTTLRTLQRPLKGASLELQPAGPAPQSLVVFAGAVQPQWRHLQWSDENTVGATWLVDAARFGRWNANVLRNERGASGVAGATQARTQTVASLAAESLFDVGAWKLRAEGELAHFQGDHDGGPGTPAARDERDRGLFLQLSGFEPRFHWRLRGERYGRDYRPFGAITPPNRRSLEAHGGWNLPDGLALRGRLQRFEDPFDAPVPVDTRVAGVNLTGGYAPWALSGALDAFVQESEDAERTADVRSTHVSAHLSRPFGPGWVGQLNAFWLEQDDRANAANSSRTQQVQVSAVAPFRLAGLAGSIAPGILHREVRGANAARDWQPTLTLALAGGAHRVSASLGRLAQDPRTAAFPDVATVNGAFEYRYRWGRHEFGIDAVVFDRRPSPGEKTEAYRIGASWTWSFEKPAAAAMRPAARAAALPAAPVPPRLERSPSLLGQVAPGQDLAAVQAALAAGGFASGLREPGAIVYEGRLLGEIEERQRLVLAHEAGRVERVVLIVSLEGAGDPARVYERVRRALLEAFGAPAFSFEEGAWSRDFAQQLAAGRFIRVAEWPTAGGVLRLGIPRRLDGVARIEVHHARHSASPRDTGWGLQGVR